MLVHYDGQSDSDESDNENVNQPIKSLNFAPASPSKVLTDNQSIHATPRTTQDMRNRRKTWNPVDVQIGSRLLTPRCAPQSSSRRVTMSVRQSFSIAALQQPSDDDTPYAEKDEFERENVNEHSITEQFNQQTISQSLLSFSCIDEDSDDSEYDRPESTEQSSNQSIDQPISQPTNYNRRLSLASSKEAAQRRKKAQAVHAARLNNQTTTQSTGHPAVPALAWPVKPSSSTRSTNNENAAPASARRQTLGAPLKKFDVPTSRARSAKKTSVPLAPLTDRSNAPSCQSTTISAAAKAKGTPRRSMKAQAEHAVEKRSARAGARQANERRASMEMKRTTRSRAQENRA